MLQVYIHEANPNPPLLPHSSPLCAASLSTLSLYSSTAPPSPLRPSLSTSPLRRQWQAAARGRDGRDPAAARGIRRGQPPPLSPRDLPQQHAKRCRGRASERRWGGGPGLRSRGGPGRWRAARGGRRLAAVARAGLGRRRAARQSAPSPRLPGRSATGKASERWRRAEGQAGGGRRVDLWWVFLFFI